MTRPRSLFVLFAACLLAAEARAATFAITNARIFDDSRVRAAGSAGPTGREVIAQG